MTFINKIKQFLTSKINIVTPPDQEMKINVNIDVNLPIIYLKKVRSKSEWSFAFDYNLEGFFKSNITYYPPVDFISDTCMDLTYDMDDTDQKYDFLAFFDLIELVINYFRQFFIKGEPKSYYLSIQMNQINIISYLKQMKFLALCYLPSLLIHIVLVAFDVTHFYITNNLELVNLLLYNVTILFAFFKKMYGIKSYIMYIFTLFKIECVIEILRFCKKGNRSLPYLTDHEFLWAISMPILQCIFGYFFGVYSILSMILMFSNLFLRSLLFYKLKNNSKDSKYGIDDEDKKSSLCVIGLTFVRFFDTCFYYLVYENSVIANKPNKVITSVIIFIWILIQSAVLIYQICTYKSPPESDKKKLDLEDAIQKGRLIRLKLEKGKIE